MKKKKLTINKSLLITKNKNKFSYQIKKLKLNKIKKNEVLIKVIYSSLNYKDILIGKGNPGLVRKYPHVPGIDCTGKVLLSNSKQYKKGDKVMVIARPAGINSFGTLSEYFISPSQWVEKIPSKLNLKIPIIFGTAGFTALLAVENIIKYKVKKNLPILITGASGGVGLISTIVLIKHGYKVVSLTSNVKKNSKYLLNLGVSKVIDLKTYSKALDHPILKAKYGAIIDNIGGSIVSYGSREIIQNGILISIGNAQSNHAKINVLTFILRGIKILGINAESTSELIRRKIWNKLSYYIKEKELKNIHKIYEFKDSVKIFKKVINKKYFGRIIFKV